MEERNTKRAGLEVRSDHVEKSVGKSDIEGSVMMLDGEYFHNTNG